MLVEPEIPQNTGNIARLCAATGSTLHLVGRLGFRTDEKAVRRAGLDYWHLVQVEEHTDLRACLDKIGCKEPLLFTTKSETSYLDAPFREGDALVFGKETKGLDRSIIETYPSLFAIPTVSGSVRSLNLANAVSVVVYEALRATGALESAVPGP
ncbi:MAG: tRNA (cytidine(34)-2'-O)-methyltransferase [Deltaproteobacteria bacterium]|nr:tRNA (cytidine(34)-2'-O)-methyltransferase [Deltaproteobacteria bacterium]